MDEILAIPTDRKPQNQTLLCALMGVTALMMLSLVNLQAQQRHAATAGHAVPAAPQLVLATR